MDTTNLEKMGLTRNQSAVYLSLLKLGSSTAQNIIKESGLHSSRVYESLEKLQDIGLVSFVVKDFKRYFQAAKPEKLLDFLEEKKEAIKQILPNLIKIEDMKKEEIKASVYKGKEGLKTIHSEMLREGKDIFVLGAKSLIFSELKYFMPNFEKQRLKRNMRWICLWDTIKARDKVGNYELLEGKVLPKGTESNGVVNIFGNKVAIVHWTEKYPTGFVIESKDITDSFRKWFKLIYEKLD